MFMENLILRLVHSFVQKNEKYGAFVLKLGESNLKI